MNTGRTGWSWVRTASRSKRAGRSLIRKDGQPGLEGCVIVQRVSPGLFSATMNARGPVNGMAIQQPNSGNQTNFLTYECDAVRCWTVPIRLSAETATRVELYGTGFRNEMERLSAF